MGTDNFYKYLDKIINNNNQNYLNYFYQDREDETKYWNGYKTKCDNAVDTFGDSFWDMVEYIREH